MVPHQPEAITMARLSAVYSLTLCILLFRACNDSNNIKDVSYSATIAEGRAAVRESMEKTDAVSISAALVDGHRIILVRGVLSAMLEPLPVEPLPIQAVPLEHVTTYPRFHASSDGICQLS